MFDLRSCKEDTRLIDPLHLLLQFGYKIRDTKIEYLTVAGDGEEVYRLTKTDLDELSGQYELGGRIWAFDHWPERLRKSSGERAFDSWSGGFLGVIQAQAEDLNKALRAWLSKAGTIQ